jgi:AsmA protein
VQLKAQTILRPQALPLERLTTRLRMRESVLTLDPLDFGAAGGSLAGSITLDGQQEPIRAHAKLAVRKLLLAKLLPTVPGAEKSVGHVNGEIELVGQGDSVARMLGTADGKVGPRRRRREGQQAPVGADDAAHPGDPAAAGRRR